MIKFFRRIRHKLLNEGRLSKYLIYAIGEIVLVVIGILIALQINNWNENRKDQSIERQILESIANNLIEDAGYLEKSKNRYRTTQLNIQRFFSDVPIPEDSLAYISTRMAGHAKFIPNTSAFSLGINSGKLDLIRDKALLEAIQRFYSFDYSSLDGIHSSLDRTIDGLRSLSKDHQVFEIRTNSMASNYFDSEYVLPWNMENLKKRNKSPALRPTLSQFHVSVDYIIMLYTQIRNKNELLVNRINEYIDTNY